MNDRVHLINALVQYPHRRTWALEHLAGIARRDLHDVPPFSESCTWQSFASAYDDPAKLKPPDWKLNIAEGADGVAGLQHEVSQSGDTRAARWSAAASLLRLCLDALDDPDEMTAEQIRRIDNATTNYTSNFGRKVLKRKGTDLQKARQEKQRRTTARHEAITATYREELAKHGRPDRAIRRAANATGVSQRTVTRALRNNDKQ